MEIFGNEKVATFFQCEQCDYFTSKKYNFDKHTLTAKHKKCYFGNNLEINGNDDKLSSCKICGRKYKTISGLWKHNSKCSKSSKKSSNKNIKPNTSQIFLDINKQDENVNEYLIEQNKLLIHQLSEQNKTLIQQNTKLFEIAQTNKNGTINNNVNSNNKFCINVFLNETCKDAINLTDFVNQINLSVSDLEETEKLGYAEGISQVFIKNLNGIDYSERPIHCSDSKREIFYIKDDGQWFKESDSKEKLTNAIKIVANKNIKQIPEWQKANPEYNDPDSKQNDKYMKILCEVMSGSSKEEQQRNYNKIIKNITKEVIIDKK
jgi:hypothetical protein